MGVKASKNGQFIKYLSQTKVADTNFRRLSNRQVNKLEMET